MHTMELHMYLHGMHLTSSMYLVDEIQFHNDNSSQNIYIRTRLGVTVDVSMYKPNIHDQIHPQHNQAARECASSLFELTSSVLG